MTIQSITALVSAQHGGVYGNASTQTIDASGEKSGAIGQPKKEGNITSVHWATGNVTTGGTVDVRIETFNSATGFPSGTLWSTTTNGSHVVGAGDDNVWLETALTSAAAVTFDDIICVIVVAGSPGNINHACHAQTGHTGGASAFPRGVLYTTSWSSGSVTPVFYLEYDDGEIVPFFNAAHAITPGALVTINTGTTPDEIGNYFTNQIAGYVSGGVVGNTLTSAAATFDLILYDGSNNVLASASTVNNIASTGYGTKTLIFTTPVQVGYGDTLRLVIKPTTANNSDIYASIIPSDACIGVMGAGCCRTHRTNAGAWTETTTEIITIMPVYSGFDDGAGSGGGMLVHPGMSGGMNG